MIFYGYMLPGMTGSKIAGSLFLVPFAAGIVGAFPLHWLFVRSPKVAAVSAVVLGVVAVRSCLGIPDDPDPSGLMFALVPLLTFPVLAVSMVASLATRAGSAAKRRGRR